MARKEEVREGRLAKRAKQGAVLAGIAAAGYAATCAHDVLSNFSPPRVPFEWKPERGRSVLLSGVSLIDVKRGQVSKDRGILFVDGQITDVVAARGYRQMPERGWVPVTVPGAPATRSTWSISTRMSASTIAGPTWLLSVSVGNPM